MPLPVTISGTKFPDENNFCGPFKSSGGNFYCVLIETTGLTIEVYKATDPTSSFSVQDTANSPVNSSSTASLWVYPVADVLHIATQDSNAGAGNVYYHTFNMATDAWGTTDELIETPKDPHATSMCSIALRSDGDVIVFYTGDKDAVMGTNYDRADYARKEGTWTVGVNVGGQGLEQNHNANTVVIGASDRMHFFWGIPAVPSSVHRSLSSANALDTQATVDSSTVISAPSHCRGISYSSGGNVVVKVGYVDADGSLSQARINVSGANPTINVDTAVSDFDVESLSRVVACLAVDGTTTHLLYSHDTDLDLYRDSQTDGGSYGTDIEVLDAVTVNHVSCNIYDRSGTKLAYVYDDGGTVKYNEVVLAAFGGEESPWTVYTAPKPEEVVMVYG